MDSIFKSSIASDRNLLGTCIIIVVLWLTYKTVNYGRREKGLPPGPPTAFGMGNLHLMPKAAAHLKLTEWARQYGGIYSLKVGHQTIIVLSDPTAVQQVMEKGGNLTQGRPSRWLMNDYIYANDHLLFTDLPEKVTSLRRAFSGMLNSKMLLSHVAIQEAESCQLLNEILCNAKEYTTSIKLYTFSVMLSIAYGFRAPRWGSPVVRTFYDFVDQMLYLASFGVTPPLDLFPVLRYMPKRFARWKRIADRARAQDHQLTADLLQIVRDRIANDNRTGSFMETAIDKQAALGLTDNMVQMFGSVALAGGSDTTACFLLSAILMLVGEEAIQAHAHEELDRVVGARRMPTLGDMEKLPYISAIIKEVERIRPVAALGIPHRATADQSYAGYRIPKDATLIVNPWAMGHDPNLYEDPERFWPERWLHNDSEVQSADKSPTFPFGVGRRICPGIGIARNSIDLVLSRLLWGFNISYAQDSATGHSIVVDRMDYAEAMLQCPNKFPCDFSPRSTEHENTIRAEWLREIPQLKSFEVGLSAEDAAFLDRQRQGQS